MRLSQTRTTNSIAMVSAADPTRSALRTRFDATNDSYSRLTVTSHVVRRDGGQIIATLPLAEVEACHEQVTGRNDPYPSAFLKERKHITSRVGRHLRRLDSPPLEAHLDHGMEWNRNPASRVSIDSPKTHATQYCTPCAIQDLGVRTQSPTHLIENKSTVGEGRQRFIASRHGRTEC
ncbi:hypothetical protein BHE74_00020497 [Ensete ventricosum]|nr:hypothetical protein BHE74_00020497 [Ensete ventricosum]